MTYGFGTAWEHGLCLCVFAGVFGWKKQNWLVCCQRIQNLTDVLNELPCLSVCSSDSPSQWMNQCIISWRTTVTRKQENRVNVWSIRPFSRGVSINSLTAVCLCSTAWHSLMMLLIFILSNPSGNEIWPIMWISHTMLHCFCTENWIMANVSFIVRAHTLWLMTSH